ncbi:hypothetical protein SAMN05444266_101341 [Chitinophaga jiangningensis]|uniref:Uncharacterized protein n=1 Tax=Chitinophaga jiangningensis TaxID=1419482 RepID=A0A1M6VS82_9BACT|nr:hypothetical protein SAMN05444266_101341 [Chitinophaga jiangningensis]
MEYLFLLSLLVLFTIIYIFICRQNILTFSFLVKGDVNAALQDSCSSTKVAARNIGSGQYFLFRNFTQHIHILAPLLLIAIYLLVLRIN